MLTGRVRPEWERMCNQLQTFLSPSPAPKHGASRLCPAWVHRVLPCLLQQRLEGITKALQTKLSEYLYISDVRGMKEMFSGFRETDLC